MVSTKTELPSTLHAALMDVIHLATVAPRSLQARAVGTFSALPTDGLRLSWQTTHRPMTLAVLACRVRSPQQAMRGLHRRVACVIVQNSRAAKAHPFLAESLELRCINSIL